jgi:hypothetical protein
MKDAATLAVPDFEAVLRGEVATEEFYKQVGRYRLRLLCRPLMFLLPQDKLIDKLNDAEEHTIDEIREVVSKLELAWEEYIGVG